MKYRTEKEIREELGYDVEIKNNVIENAQIRITAHFGNTVSVCLLCPNISVFPLYNSTQNVGYIMRTLLELLDKSREDGIDFAEALKDTPIRLIFDNYKCVGLGHFLKDRFILTEDLMKVSE